MDAPRRALDIEWKGGHMFKPRGRSILKELPDPMNSWKETSEKVEHWA